MHTVCLLLLPHITTMLLCNIDKCGWLQCVVYYIAAELSGILHLARPQDIYLSCCIPVLLLRENYTT